VKYGAATLAILAALSASLALAEDFKTNNGKEYKDATVTRMEPDGIFVKTKTGIIKLYFAELPPEVQRRFNYNPQQAAAFAAAQAPSYSPTQNQQQAPADGGNARVGQIDDTVNAIWALDGRLAQIQSDEAILEQRIHEMERWHLGKLERADLAELRRQLVDLRREEREVKNQLSQARSRLSQLQKAQR
jgi:hypothetical protein